MTTILKVIAVSSLILIYSTRGINSKNNSCGDWATYKEEKCLKVFTTATLLDFVDAENFCQEQEESHLLSIDSQDKQNFVQTFLTSNNVVDNIWIGLKYVNKSYQWLDGTASLYTNWASGSPKNNDSYCVQLLTESVNFGLWSDELCSKKNFVVCEKIQLWSLTEIQTSLMNLIKHPGVPVGFIYVQLPNEKEPTEIWPFMGWEDVSSYYAGVFFRAVGGNSEAFGKEQAENSPRLVSMKIVKNTTVWADEINVNANNQYSGVLDMNGAHKGTDWDLAVKVSGGEVRPRNMAVKIWKRVT